MYIHVEVVCVSTYILYLVIMYEDYDRFLFFSSTVFSDLTNCIVPFLLKAESLVGPLH